MSKRDLIHFLLCSFVLALISACGTSKVVPTQTASSETITPSPPTETIPQKAETKTPVVTASVVATHFSTETPTALIPKTPTISASPIPLDEVISPDGQFVAKLYSEFYHPSKKEAIEIWDDQGSVLWVLTYHGEMPIYDPRPSLAIYQWASDSSSLYFYYSFAYDGGITLFDGNDLQSIDVKTGEITEIAPGRCIAFAFSPDLSKLVYLRDGKISVRDITTGSERTAEIQSTGFEQAGLISWSPTGNKLVFSVLIDVIGSAQLIFVEAESLKQQTLLDHFIEDQPFDGWTEYDDPRYILDGNIIIVDSKTGIGRILGTATPNP